MAHARQAAPLRATYAQPGIHDRWDEVYGNDPLHERFNARLFARLVARLDAARGHDVAATRVLDAGCGTGNQLWRFRERGYRCVGVDLSRYALRRAADRLRAAGLAEGVELCESPLESLPFRDGSFDVVHCRGVLMHIPDWRAALTELCRVVRPGGVLVVIEANDRALELGLVRAVRALTRRRSRMQRTPDGVEFWSESDGRPFVVRVADQAVLGAALAECGFPVQERFATEFWDINRFPKGVPRDAAIRFNSFWLARAWPAAPCLGQALLARHAPPPHRAAAP